VVLLAGQMGCPRPRAAAATGPMARLLACSRSLWAARLRAGTTASGFGAVGSPNL